MKLMYKLLVSALVLTLVVVYGCSDRGPNTAPIRPNDSGVLEKDHVFYNELMVQIRNAYQQFFMSGYAYKAIEWTDAGEYKPPERLPMLILLPPNTGDEYYYFNHGLAQIANELIDDGIIDPMLIITPSNDKNFGGYWWSGDGGGSGDMDALIGGAMIDYLYDTVFTSSVKMGPGYLGIGGLGTGAYGAFRAAMLHPGRFGAVSGIDGPLDFDGGTYGSGLPALFPQVLAEQNLLGDPDFAQKFDSLSSHRLSRLFIGGSEAFSPHDTIVLPVIKVVATGPVISCPVIDTTIDTISFTPFVTDTTYEQRRWQIAGTRTLVDGIIGDGINNGFEQHFHLPFDENGDPFSVADEPIWSLWMRNNLDSLYLNAGGNAGLADAGIWLAYSTDPDPLGFNQQTRDWIAFLQGQGLSPEVMPYAGYAGSPAIGDRYLNQLLRDLLIFHDQKFKEAKAADAK